MRASAEGLLEKADGFQSYCEHGAHVPSPVALCVVATHLWFGRVEAGRVLLAASTVLSCEAPELLPRAAGGEEDFIEKSGGHL